MFRILNSIIHKYKKHNTGKYFLEEGNNFKASNAGKGDSRWNDSRSRDLKHLLKNSWEICPPWGKILQGSKQRKPYTE